MKILHLTLKRKWFDMIASGEKTEEYREIKHYWGTRLLYKIPVPWGGYLSAWSNIEKGDYTFKEWSALVSPNCVFEKFTGVLFSNGYSKDSRKLSMLIENISIGNGREEWGAEPDKLYFIIKIKPII